MDVFLPDFDLNEATWFCLSLLLIIAVFFRFSRVWSLRNLDLGLLLCISPGLLLAGSAPSIGYAWLFGLTLFLLLRLFCDGLFQRRPKTEQNLNTPGLIFLLCATLAFLTTLVLTEELPDSTVATVRQGKQLLDGEGTPAEVAREKVDAEQTGPAGGLIAAPLVLAARNGAEVGEQSVSEEIASRVLALLSHLAIVAGLLYIGYFRFGELQLGIAMATLYLLLPSTAFEVGQVVHVLPAALILWALALYRQPMLAGGLMGLACGTLGFPIFLLPLWIAFYGWRGAVRFGLALGIVGAVLLATLAWTTPDIRSFMQQSVGVFDWSVLKFQDVEGTGFWATTLDVSYRIPMFATFVIMLVVLTAWPRKKNLEQLMANCTAVVVGTQFLYPEPGGVYLLWYLPLLLTVVFRPRLAHLSAPDFKAKRAEQQQAPAPVGRELALSGRASAQLFR